MHVVQLLRSDHLAPSGGRSNFGENTDFCTSDFHLCGECFTKTVEQNSMRHGTTILEGVVDAQFSFF